MLPTNLFTKEIVEDFKDRRALIFKFALPMILLAPLAFVPMPLGVKASIIAILVLFLGVFGSAVGLAKLREGGLLERLAISPASKRSMIGQYVLANSLMDSLQLLIPISVLVFRSAFPGSVVIFFATFLSAVLASNSLGAAVAVASGSSGEVHLFATLSVLLVAAASGLFMSLSGALLEISSISPFSHLSTAFLALWQNPSHFIWPSGILVSLLIFFFSLLLSNRFFKSP